jgi:hypothetical protein
MGALTMLLRYLLGGLQSGVDRHWLDDLKDLRRHGLIYPHATEGDAFWDALIDVPTHALVAHLLAAFAQVVNAQHPSTTAAPEQAD